MNYEVIPSVAERLMNCPPIAQPIVCQPISSSYPQNQPMQYPQQPQYIQQPQYPVQYIQQPQYPVQYIQQPQYPVQYIQQPQYQMHPNPYDRPMVVMNGTNPIRGMYTSVYTDICSHYGSSTINPNPADFYQGTRWCNVGILMGNPMYSLEARFRGNAWEHRAKDSMTGLFIQMSQQGNASYGAFRTNDSVDIPGKHGVWTVQVQTDSAPYVLYT